VVHPAKLVFTRKAKRKILGGIICIFYSNYDFFNLDADAAPGIGGALPSL